MKIEPKFVRTKIDETTAQNGSCLYSCIKQLKDEDVTNKRGKLIINEDTSVNELISYNGGKIDKLYKEIEEKWREEKND